MRLVPEHNALVTRTRRHPAIERESKSAENPRRKERVPGSDVIVREKSAADFRRILVAHLGVQRRLELVLLLLHAATDVAQNVVGGAGMNALAVDRDAGVLQAEASLVE